jgi:hypothetical protein
MVKVTAKQLQHAVTRLAAPDRHHEHDCAKSETGCPDADMLIGLFTDLYQFKGMDLTGAALRFAESFFKIEEPPIAFIEALIERKIERPTFVELQLDYVRFNVCALMATSMHIMATALLESFAPEAGDNDKA